jgi:glycosyltransferase involved in cell wall biosynthesis
MPGPRVTILCLAKVGAEMTSPAIRAYELARVLSRAGAEVSLLATEVDDAQGMEVVVDSFDRHRGLGDKLAGAEVVLAQPQWPLVMRDLRRSGARLIFDLYYPDTLEKLEHTAVSPARTRDLRIAMTVDRFNEATRIGHHLICASEVQRDLWLGTMLGQGLIRPKLYDRDPSLRSAIDVVPFGVPDEPPRSGGRSPWAKFRGIGEGDEVVLWNGGIWPWLDAATALRAIDELAARRPTAKLVFMAGPNDEMSRAAGARARDLAAELGLLDRSVFFNSGWVPYAERGEWLLAASCALHCHRPSQGTRFALSRALDCFWAGLPVVSSGGDAFAEEIEREDLGAVASQGDPEAVARAIERVLDRGRQSYAEALGRAAERYRWDRAAEALIRFATESDATPRLGEGMLRRPSHQLRTAAYFLSRGALRRRRGSTRLSA